MSAPEMVVVSAERLAELVREQVDAALEAHDPAAVDALTLSGAELALRLGVSRTTVFRMREQGCPALRLGDVYRYEVANVLAWLRGRK